MASSTTKTELDPIGQLYEDLTLLVNTAVIKFSTQAEKNESLTSRKYTDGYLDAVQGFDNFFTYSDYTIEEFTEAGVEDIHTIAGYIDDLNTVPTTLQQKLLENRRKFIIDSYEEPNEYYRILNGLPPLSVNGPLNSTSVIQAAFDVVPDDDDDMDYERQITVSGAQKLLSSLSIEVGYKVLIHKCTLEDLPQSATRSFLIVADDYIIPYGKPYIHLRDAINIAYILNDETAEIGKYLHIAVEFIQTVTNICRNSLLVVADDYEEYDATTMIKLSEAKTNLHSITEGEYILLRDYFYVSEEFQSIYGISTRVPIHEIEDFYGNQYVSILESTGFLDTLITNNPTMEYLKFIGSKKISIVTARKAKNFEILYISRDAREYTTSKFVTLYSGSRDYFVNTVYNPYYRGIYDYYDNFIGLAIMQMTVQQVIARAAEGAIGRDFYDDRMIQMLFQSYGIPYSSRLSYHTQRQLSKNLNMLIMNKGNNKVLYDIASLLGYHDILIYKYYLIKERNWNSDDEMVYQDTTKTALVYNEEGQLVEDTVVVNDLENMYNVYFQKVELSDLNYEKALIDESHRVDYNTITQNDPLWWDDDATWEEVYGDPTKYTAETEPEMYHRHYNYTETKYLGVTISYKLSEILYENIMLLRMIFDKKTELTDLFVTFPKLTGSLQVTLFDAIVFLCALICERYHLTGEILTKVSTVLDVIGYMNVDADAYTECDTLAFNFDKVTNAETFKEIINRPSHYLKPDEEKEFFSYFEVLTMPQSSVNDKIDAFNKMYSNITSLGYFIGRKMAESDNMMEYRAWRDLYQALYVGKENAKMFNIGETGETAKTYKEYLEIMNPTLYNVIADIDPDDEYILYSYIDHVIYRVEQIVEDLDSLFIVNDSNSSAHDYLMKLMRFFKSYTVDFLDISTQYVFDVKPDNLFKLVEHYKIHKVNITPDNYKLMYSDVMHIIATKREYDELFFDDFIALHKNMTLNESLSVNNLTCQSCKNTKCLWYCRNKQSTCNGYYLLFGKPTKCSYFGTNASEFIKLGEQIIFELQSLPDKHLVAQSMAIADLSQFIHITMDRVSDVRQTDPDIMDVYTSIFDSFEKWNTLADRLIDLYGMDLDPYLKDWKASLLDCLTTVIFDTPFICRNEAYPCVKGTCETFEGTKETIDLDKVLGLYYNRHNPLFDDMLKVIAHESVLEYLTLRENNKYKATYHTLQENNHMKLEDTIALSAYTKTLDYFSMYDTLSLKSNVKERDTFSMKDNVIIIPREPSEK